MTSIFASRKPRPANSSRAAERTFARLRSWVSVLLSLTIVLLAVASWIKIP